MKLQDFADDALQFVNPELTERIHQLVQDLEAVPGVSVAVLVHQDGGTANPIAVGGDARAIAVHTARVVPGLLIATGVAELAALECPCPGCTAAREAAKVRA